LIKTHWFSRNKEVSTPILHFIGDNLSQKKELSKKSSHCFIKKKYNSLSKDEQNQLLYSLMKYQIQLIDYVACSDLKRINAYSLMSQNKKNDDEDNDH
jgi:hypothetical protein